MRSEQKANLANIGPGERRRRLIMGIVMLAFSIVVLGAMVLNQIHPLWRIALFLPLWLSMLGFFQAQEQT